MPFPDISSDWGCEEGGGTCYSTIQNLLVMFSAVLVTWCQGVRWSGDTWCSISPPPPGTAQYCLTQPTPVLGLIWIWHDSPGSLWCLPEYRDDVRWEPLDIRLQWLRLSAGGCLYRSQEVEIIWVGDTERWDVTKLRLIISLSSGDRGELLVLSGADTHKIDESLTAQNINFLFLPPLPQVIHIQITSGQTLGID